MYLRIFLRYVLLGIYVDMMGVIEELCMILNGFLIWGDIRIMFGKGKYIKKLIRFVVYF